VFLLRDANLLPEAQKIDVYVRVHVYALIIPVVSVAGVLFASWLRRRDAGRLRRQGVTKDEIRRRLDVHSERPPVNWWVLGGGLAFAVLSLGVGLGNVPAAEEIVFAVSMTIVVTLMVRLTRDLAPTARETLLGTALVI